MESDRKRVVLITGASSGIGKACAEHLSRTGHRVFGTSRHAPEPCESSGSGTAEKGALELIPMDVTSNESVSRGVNLVLARAGRLDVVINNAGYGLAGAVEDTELDEAQAQLETNLLGVFRVCRATLPLLRRQGEGTVVNISSIGGLIGIPFQALYSASKFAIEGLTESLRAEVRPYGVRVVLVEPGDFRTGFTANRLTTRAARAGTVYGPRFAKAIAVMERDETHAPTPEQVASLIERIITSRSPRLRYMVGPGPERLAVGLKKVIPSKLFEWAILKYYQML